MNSLALVQISVWSIPAHGAKNQCGLGLSPLENRRSDCLLHDLFRLPAALAQSCNTVKLHRTSTRNRVRFTRTLPLLCFILLCGCGDDKVLSVLDRTLTRISLPETPFADSTLGIGNASGVAVHPDGRVFVSSLYGKDDLHFYGKILVLRDEDGDGIADRSTVFADSLTTVTGVAFRGDEVYASIYGEVIVFFRIPTEMIEPIREIRSCDSCPGAPM